MTGMLASVATLAEARLAARAGVDIIDLKAPQAGALGALPQAAVRCIVADLDGSRPVSATIGDLPMEPETVLAAARNMAATGVDYVKIGFFAGGDWTGCVAALASLAAEVPLVAVLFGDQYPDFRIVPRLARAGFRGAMLDTADKGRGSLTGLCALGDLGEFVERVQGQGMLCGLAGSLRPADVPLLRPLRPDYLGFRGALCRGSRRTSAIDEAALMDVRALLRQTLSPQPVG